MKADTCKTRAQYFRHSGDGRDELAHTHTRAGHLLTPLQVRGCTQIHAMSAVQGPEPKRVPPLSTKPILRGPGRLETRQCRGRSSGMTVPMQAEARTRATNTPPLRNVSHKTSHIASRPRPEWGPVPPSAPQHPATTAEPRSTRVAGLVRHPPRGLQEPCIAPLQGVRKCSVGLSVALPGCMARPRATTSSPPRNPMLHTMLDRIESQLAHAHGRHARGHLQKADRCAERLARLRWDGHPMPPACGAKRWRRVDDPSFGGPIDDPPSGAPCTDDLGPKAAGTLIFGVPT